MNGFMASACATSSSPLVSAPSACPSSARFRRRTVSRKATGGGNNDGLLRREVMLNGLSGVAAGLAWYPGVASADEPVSQCEKADKVNQDWLLCTDEAIINEKPCPLRATKPPVDFTPAGKVTRLRQPVHLLSREYQEKYKEAVGKMKALPESNPLSFAAQADIHQAYCDSYYRYEMSSGTDPVFDVHYSWLFAPWHRMYLYFYERALGDLIGDDTFALPYWNWDTPAGMVVPALFKDKFANPLYDPNRNQANLDALVDLDYTNDRDKKPIIPFKGPKDEEYEKLVQKNLCTVWKQQQVGSAKKDALAYLGEKYCTASRSSQGFLNGMAHIAMHVWVGRAGAETCDAAFPNHSSSTPGQFTCLNDMGFLGSAGRDPLFYSHHSNVDRMWHLWSARLGGGQGITDPDWLDATFVFYDDVKNPHKVRIKFRDVLDTSNLGYTFDPKYDKDLPWLRPKITKLVPAGNKDSGKTKQEKKKFPVTLVKNQVVEVPGVAVPPKEKGTLQLLVIDDIEFDPQANNKFDVAINVPADKALQVGPQYKEYAGSFAIVPGSGGGTTRQGKIALCITDVLNDIEAAGDSTVDIVIVPRTPAKVTLNARPTIKNRSY